MATTRFYQGYNYLQAAQELSESHQWERAAEYAEAAFLLADLGSMDVYWGASEYAEILEKLKDPVRRADVLRAAWIESLQPFASSMQYMFSNGYSSSLRFSAQKEKLARAIVCIVQDDMPGFQHQVAVARKLQSQDIEVVCQCYPLLQKAGKTAIAEELFASYEADMQQQLAWPNDATALNNLAWMYSQCDVKLDEAAGAIARTYQVGSQLGGVPGHLGRSSIPQRRNRRSVRHHASMRATRSSRVALSRKPRPLPRGKVVGTMHLPNDR
ncbi:MAG: hypothetical protein R3C56_03450 [Pirellulaceae bacterium]